jgi:anti-sigma regulatory factor (Ser/Thr protein kinase)
MAITDVHGIIVMVNSAFQQIWGDPLPEIQSIGDYAAHRARWVDTGKPVAPDEWASAKSLQEGTAVVGQVFEIRRFDGARGFVINSASPVRDIAGEVIGSAVAIQDITALRSAEEAARAAEDSKLQFYRRTIAAATDEKLVITDRSEIEWIAGPALATWKISSPEDTKTVRHNVETIARSICMEESRLGRLVVAVGEATTNVVKHAVHGEACIHRKEDALIIVVSDHGPGIPVIALPDVALMPGYSTAGTLGMGYKIMIRFADKICLATDSDGTTVSIEMKIHPSAELPLLALHEMEKRTEL